MGLKVSRCLPLFVLSGLFATQLPVAAQSIPCSAITRNPLVLEALLDSHSEDDEDAGPGDTINAAQLEHLQFSPILIQPGDALYVEYRGRDFTVDADFASGERTAFDSSPKGSYDEWRKGILPLDMFREALSQRLIRLRATAKNPNQVLFRNIKIIRAGRSVFEFAKLATYGRTQLKAAARKELPCKGVDKYPNELTALTQANLSVPANNLPKAPLTLTAQEINSVNVDYAPVIQAGDFLIFESNRRDFIFHILLSNGKEIVSQPLNQEDAEDTSIGWRKGRIRLDYPEALNQRIVRQAVVPLHEDSGPLLIRGITIDGNRELIFELEKSQPGKAKPNSVEPPMSYPPDPHVMTASATTGNIWGKPGTGFLAPKLPTFSMHPMMFQSGTSTSDPNHFKFIGAELDSESGLYHMGARYYSTGLGRFVQPDPLYIEMHRLSDPQSLNLYAYARNNPVTLSDPTGLDFKLKCDSAANCNQAVQDFNGRKGAQFQVTLGKDNKLHVVAKSVGKNLTKAEGALLSAVKNQDHTATINVAGNTGQSEFGVHNSAGVNTVDLGNLSKLDASSNAGGLSSGDALAHEALDAYYSLFLDAGEADSSASQFYPGLNPPTQNQNAYSPAGTRLTGATQYQGITDGRGGERVTFQYITPVPAIDLFGKTPAQKNEITHDAGSRVTGVTFEPKKQQ